MLLTLLLGHCCLLPKATIPCRVLLSATPTAGLPKGSPALRIACLSLFKTVAVIF